MALDKTAFFNHVRAKLGRLSALQVAGFEAVLSVIDGAPLSHQAYMLATDTYSMAFVGQEQQSSNTIRLAFSKPWIQFGSTDMDNSIDREALIASISKNGKPWDPSVS